MTISRQRLSRKLGRRAGLVASLVAVGTVLAACSSSDPPVASPTTTSTTQGPVYGPQAAAATTSTTAPTKPTTTTTEVAIPLSAITDTGLPARVGPGPLKAAQVKTLMQFFENHVAAEFAAGDANGLQTYLAGSMLTGNRGTINVLNGQSRRNIYKIDVTKIIMNANETDRAVFEMKGNMTVDYFENATTNQPVADELPGPSPVDFLVFLDFNPNNRTWYWTGEQNYSTSDSSSSGST
jgi:hypothetical protein